MKQTETLQISPSCTEPAPDPVAPVEQAGRQTLPEAETGMEHPPTFRWEALKESASSNDVVYVPAITSGERKTYLLPLSNDSTINKNRISAIQELGNDVRLRVLPVGDDTLSGDERQRVEQDLGLGFADYKSDYFGYVGEDQAIVFDPTSVKSILDVLIASGSDTDELRMARRAALRGETNQLADTLQTALDAVRTHNEDQNDMVAAALHAAYGLSSCRVSIDSLIEEIVEKGVEKSFILQRIRAGNKLGLQSELIMQTVTRPEALRDDISAAWREAVEYAREHNHNLKDAGAYVELHRIGNTLVPLVALTDTTSWSNSSPRSLGYVNVESGHTLAEIYAEADQFPSQKWVRGFKIITLARQLGIVHRTTLERRCLLEIKDDGEPIVHILESPIYAQQMSDEALWHGLDQLGIRSDSITEDGKTIDVKAEIDRTPVKVSIWEDGRYKQTEHDPQITVGYLGGGTDTDLYWLVGHTKLHQNLWQDAYKPDGNPATGIHTMRLGNDIVDVRALYLADRGRGLHTLLWQFYGDPDTIRTFAGRIAHMTAESAKALGEHMRQSQETLTDNPNTEVYVRDPQTGENIRVLFK